MTEIAILRSIHHPNIIALLDFFETKDAICLVFEQASGGELFDRLEHLGHYTERDAACIAAVLCNALDYIHQRGILHRDIKTHNVLFMDKSFDSRIVLVDFGISKILMDPRGFTQTIGMGTPSFTAPEVIEGVKYGAKCDDWSLGVLIHHLLAGYGPFDSFLDYADILAKQAEGPKFDTEEWTVITPEAKDFVRRMLSVRPSKRMTAGEALSHPWIKMMVPDMYLAQLRSINDRLLGIVRASTPLPSGSVTPIPISGKSEPEAAHSTEAPPAILSSSMLSPDELASETLKMSASLSASVPSPLFISQSLNRAAVGKLPDLIPKELSESDLPETMPISIASRGRTAADGDAVSGSLLPLETPDSLPDFAKADSIGVPIGSYVSVELPGLTMRKRQASVSSAAALKSLSTAPINASKMVPVGESAGELMADIQAETE